MKVLMLLKTSEGASWALQLAERLRTKGITIYAVLPKESGELYPKWEAIAKDIQLIDLNIRKRNVASIAIAIRKLRDLANSMDFDIVHSFFYDTTLIARLAYKRKGIPIVFHVPGPLHMEHILTRYLDIYTATQDDFWIASSEATENLYLKSRIDRERLFLSYFGVDLEYYDSIYDKYKVKNEEFRQKYNIPKEDIVIFNVNYFYPPKYYLFQRKGLKNHETIINVFSELLKRYGNLTLLIVGKQWGGGESYENKLRKMGSKKGRNKIIFTGFLRHDEAMQAILSSDINLHVPFSENCGGILEAALLRKPIITARVGGLTEIVEDETKGYLVASLKPGEIYKKVEEALGDMGSWEEKALRANKVARRKFNIKETSRKVMEIYQQILNYYKIDEWKKQMICKGENESDKKFY